MRVRVISGEEEADYIYRAVRTAVDLDGSTALCVDIGGGSVEFIVGTASEIYFTASEPLGVLRLAQRFRLEDRPAPSDIEACRQFTAQHLKRLQKRIRPIGVDCGIGTSGTIQALAGLTAPGDQTTSSALRAVKREALDEIVSALANASASERVEKFNLDEKRARNIVAGALVLHELMSILGLQSVLACPVAIREGILENRLSEKRAAPERASSVRRKSALALADRSSCDRRHAQHVARLARRIFNQTRDLHRVPRVHVHRDVVLQIAPWADGDRVAVGAQHGVVPDARTLGQADRTDHPSARRDEGRGIDIRSRSGNGEDRGVRRDRHGTSLLTP